jgi:hypothetical protein
MEGAPLGSQVDIPGRQFWDACWHPRPRPDPSIWADRSGAKGILGFRSEPPGSDRFVVSDFGRLVR